MTWRMRTPIIVICHLSDTIFIVFVLQLAPVSAITSSLSQNFCPMRIFMRSGNRKKNRCDHIRRIQNKFETDSYSFDIIFIDLWQVLPHSCCAELSHAKYSGTTYPTLSFDIYVVFGAHRTCTTNEWLFRKAHIILIEILFVFIEW